MADVTQLSDGELRSELEGRGCRVGPLTEDTRRVYELQLLQLRKKTESESDRRSSSEKLSSVKSDVGSLSNLVSSTEKFNDEMERSCDISSALEELDGDKEVEVDVVKLSSEQLEDEIGENDDMKPPQQESDSEDSVPDEDVPVANTSHSLQQAQRSSLSKWKVYTALVLAIAIVLYFYFETN